MAGSTSSLAYAGLVLVQEVALTVEEQQRLRPGPVILRRVHMHSLIRQYLRSYPL